MINYISGLVFVMLLLVGAAVALVIAMLTPVWAVVFAVAWFVVELKMMMSRQASAEREKRATITRAEGDCEASTNLAAAAETMASSPGAMQLRTLQTIDGLGPTASNTVVPAVPIDIMDAINSFTHEFHRSNGDMSPHPAQPTRAVP